jgi:hypothetical protein
MDSTNSRFFPSPRTLDLSEYLSLQAFSCFPSWTYHIAKLNLRMSLLEEVLCTLQGCPMATAFNTINFIITFFFFFCSSGDWVQGLAKVRQVLYHMSHAPSPFVFNLTLKQGLQLPLPGLSSNSQSFCFCLLIAGFPGMCHHIHFFF